MSLDHMAMLLDPTIWEHFQMRHLTLSSINHTDSHTQKNTCRMGETKENAVKLHRNPKWILISPAKQPFRVETCHSTLDMNALCLLTYPEQSPPLWVTDWEWQEVRDTVSFLLSVSDPPQRDANQVHLPATQRLLAAHHASEQRGRSLQLPRCRHEVSNYHTHGVAAISLPACVSGNVWSTLDGRRWRKDEVEKQEGGGINLPHMGRHSYKKCFFLSQVFQLVSPYCSVIGLWSDEVANISFAVGQLAI